MVFRTVYDHLYTTPLSDNHSPLHSWIWVSKCMPSSHRNQFSFSPPICAKSIWCKIGPQVSIVQGHKGKLFFCHIAILIVLQIVNIFSLQCPWLMSISQFLFGVDLTYSGLHSLLIEQVVICAGTQVITTWVSSHNVPKRQVPVPYNWCQPKPARAWTQKPPMLTSKFGGCH
jgi:hypothetical protein